MQRIGSLEQVKQRFPSDKLAIGKLGVVSCEGKDDRLIGESRASGASPAALFSERAEVPSLYHFSAALDRFAEWSYKQGKRAKPIASAEDWCLFSIDIKGAHKSVRTHPEDVGLAVFQVEGEHFAYVNNHFGASWSAYWWSRLSALLLRVMHHVLRHCHVGGVYVDDFLWLLPRETAPLMASLLTALLQILNVLISWRKLAFGRSLSYTGWKLSLIGGFSAQLPINKQERILAQVQHWIIHPRRVSRDDLSRLLGLLVWATQVKLTLRPFLAPLFAALHRPSQELRCVGLQQIEEIVQLLGENLVPAAAARSCDAQAGWRLSSVGSLVVRDLQQARQLLEQPRLKNGKVWLRFKAWSRTMDLDKAAVRSLQVLQQSLRANLFSWAGSQTVLSGAADAWADATKAGLGGWFESSTGLHWFHVPLRREDIPADWDFPLSMQKAISSLELLAQLALLLARVRVEGAGFKYRAVLHQQSDNMAVVGCLAKGLATKPPLATVLMHLARHCLKVDCALDVAHIAGERNELADRLSRLNEDEARLPPAALQGNKVELTVAELMSDVQL